MLRFTDQQQNTLKANRRGFNARQRELQNSLGNGEHFVGNAMPLPKDVWGEWDMESIQIQRDVLAVFGDLAASVSRPIAIGKLIHYIQTVTDSGEVNVSLDGRSKARSDQPEYDYEGTPIPIVDSVFSYGWRQMEAAATEGFNLDGDGRVNANRKVAEKLEDMSLNGDTKVVVSGAPLYGLRTHPKRNTRTTGVTLNGATGAQWHAEVVATLKALHDANFRVGITMYLNWSDWFYASSTDYSTEYPNKSILQRISEIEGIESIVPASKVPASELIGVVKRPTSIQVLNAMPQSTRARFRANPEDDYEFVTMAAAAVQIKSDAEDQCGVVHSAPV